MPARSTSKGHSGLLCHTAPIRVVGEMIAREIYCPSPGVFVYDFGQNFSGWGELRVSGPRGTEVKLRYAELITENRQLNPRTNEWAESTDNYILKGDGIEVYEPKFTYHGFRYVELTGFPGTPDLQSLVGKIVHSDVESAGGFSCSNELVNQIHQNVRWTQLSNLMGIPTDCPQRNERMGWLGDAYVSSEEAMLNFWMPGFFEKWLNDIKDAQTPDGSVQGVAPAYWTRNPADPVWGMAYIMIPYELYLYYGDERVLETHYESMKNYLEFVSSKYSNDYLVSLSLNGDYCAPAHIRSQETPGELISTWAYLTCALTLSKIAQIVNKTVDHEKYSGLASHIRDAFNARFLKKRWDRGKDFEMESYGDTQTCNILPLEAGIVPEVSVNAVLQSLLLNISRHHDNHLDTGIVGTKFLFNVLSRHQ
ncbi:MAG: family 78 glycoside hydrolase catalytic domain, partial [Nitrososphaerales archaeon]